MVVESGIRLLNGLLLGARRLLLLHLVTRLGVVRVTVLVGRVRRVGGVVGLLCLASLLRITRCSRPGIIRYPRTRVLRRLVRAPLSLH